MNKNKRNDYTKELKPIESTELANQPTERPCQCFSTELEC